MDIYEPHKLEVHNEGSWSETHYREIKNGDKFRMYHQDGNPFFYEHEEEGEYFAVSEPYFDEELGAWFITIK